MSWLDIPLSDYEAHMALPGVGQAQMLSQELASAVTAHRARSVAVVGCAGGNGFARLASFRLARLVGIDINPAYIEAARGRYAGIHPGLELHVADIEAGMPGISPVDLVFAGLVLEYLDLRLALRNLRALCDAGCGDAHLVALIQLASSAPVVSASPYTSLQSLRGRMTLHEPAAVVREAAAVGFTCASERRIVLPSGKEFAVLTLAAA